MVDIHTHILPGVDDGSPDLLDSMLMAELAAESDVNTIFATPHSHVAGETPEEHLAHIRESFQRLEEEIRKRKIPLLLVQGMEIFCGPDLRELLENGLALPLGDSGRYLIEFRFGEGAATCRRHIETVLEWGGHPVIAHPERYDCIQQDRNEAKRWSDMGCQLQVNRGSAFGHFGRAAQKAAVRMLRDRLVTYVASDAHSPYRRTTFMGDIREYLCEEYSAELATRLLEGNARRYLLGEDTAAE